MKLFEGRNPARALRSTTIFLFGILATSCYAQAAKNPAIEAYENWQTRMKAAKTIQGRYVSTTRTDGKVSTVEYTYFAERPNKFAVLVRERGVLTAWQACDGKTTRKYTFGGDIYTSKICNMVLKIGDMPGPFENLGQLLLVSGAPKPLTLGGRKHYKVRLKYKSSEAMNVPIDYLFYFDVKTGNLSRATLNTPIYSKPTSIRTEVVYYDVRVNGRIHPVMFTRDYPVVTAKVDVKKLLVGQAAPIFAARTTAGKTLKLDDLLKTKRAALLFFWTKSSGDMARQLQTMHQIHQQYRESDLAVIAINPHDSSEVIASLWKAKGYSMHAVADKSVTISGWYGIGYYPATLLVGKKGKIEFQMGEFRRADLDVALWKLGVRTR